MVRVSRLMREGERERRVGMSLYGKSEVIERGRGREIGMSLGGEGLVCPVQ